MFDNKMHNINCRYIHKDIYDAEVGIRFAASDSAIAGPP